MLLVGVLLLVGVCGWVLLDMRQVQSDLTDVASGISTIQDSVLAGDTDDVQPVIASVQADAAEAERITSRPHWSIAAALPWVGPNVSALRTVVTSADDIAADALPQLSAIADLLDPGQLVPVDGSIDLAPLTEAAPAIVASDASVQAAHEEIAAIDRDALLPVVADAVDEVAVHFDEAASQTGMAARVVQLLPAMLGDGQPRDYLVLVQNNAEPRATGGIPGVVLLLHAESGRLEITEQRSALSIGRFADPVLELGSDETALFGTQLGRYMQDVTFTPDFPRTAQLAQAMWQERYDLEVDGVLSIDPVALQGMLAATGPITVDGVELTEENAAEVLLNGIYLDRPDPEDQDAFFASAASAVFTEFSSGSADATTAVDALADQVATGRVSLWSAHPDEQALLSGSTIAGELRGQFEDRPIVGVFVNDGSAAKIGYYLDSRVTLESMQCRPNGSQELHLQIELTSTAPADAATALPDYVTGAGSDYVDPGDMRFNLLLYAPTGGAITAVNASDGSEGVLSQLHQGLPVAARSVLLGPGESASFEVTMLSGPDSTGDPLLRLTPGARPTDTEVSGTTCS